MSDGVGTGGLGATFAVEFGGMDGFGGDGEDRADLKAAGFSYDSDGPTKIQDVLNAGGNLNQFHHSESGVEQSKRIFSLAEAEGMLADKHLSADELTQLKGMIDGSVAPSSAAGKGLAAEINANKDALSGSPQMPHGAPSGAEAMAAQAEELMDFDFFDWLLETLGMTEEQLAEAWKTPEGKQKVMYALKAKLEEAGVDPQEIEEALTVFEGSMDAGDMEGAVSLIESTIAARSEALTESSAMAGDLQGLAEVEADDPSAVPEGDAAAVA